MRSSSSKSSASGGPSRTSWKSILEKNPLIKKFWDVLFEFSKNLSCVTSLTIGKEVDYFRALKERIDIYLKALAEVPHVKDPASVIGPTFARLCGNADNVHVIMAGNRIFHMSLEGVKYFLESAFSKAADILEPPCHEERYGALEAEEVQRCPIY